MSFRCNSKSVLSNKPSAQFGQTAATAHRRSDARLIGPEMLTLTDIANDIVALDRAANDASLDAEGMAEAQGVAARLMCWATAQLKSEAELAAAAEGGGTSGVFDAGVIERDRCARPGGAVGAVSDLGERQEQEQEQQAQTTAAAFSSSIIPTEQWPEPVLLPRAGPEAWERWDFARASGAAHKNQCGSGNADGSLDALQQMRSLSLVCLRPGCSALVDYKVARRQAKQAGRVSFEPGDGCAGRLPCSDCHKPPRFSRDQRATAAKLESGERLLVRWPLDRDDHEVWAYPMEVARSAAASARLALEEPRPRQRKGKRKAS
jgi:hypothetical protein